MTTFPLEQAIQNIRTAVHEAINVAEQSPPQQMLTADTPQIVAALNEALSDVRVARSVVVRHLRDQGNTHKTIAKHVGLSTARIHQIASGQ
jgi:hypothetical protein